jgi:hypothetical protein
VRGKVAETFKRREADGRWLWRLIGDDRTSSRADIEDMFGGDPVGLVASGRSAKPAKGRNDSDASGEDTDDDDDDDDDAECGKLPDFESLRRNS